MGLEPMRWKRVKKTCLRHVFSVSPDRACEGGVRIRAADTRVPPLLPIRRSCKWVNLGEVPVGLEPRKTKGALALDEVMPGAVPVADIYISYLCRSMGETLA